MRKPTRSTEGFTLVELLIAAAILIVVLGIVTQGLVAYLRYTGDVQTNVNVQTQLRRTMELVTQDLRNASFGMLAAAPYTTAQHSISLMQMNDTSAYQVLRGTAAVFQNANNFQFAAPATAAWSRGSLVLLLSPSNGQGTALVLSSDATGAGHNWTAAHAKQANSICWDSGMLAVKATAIGYRYDAANKLLVRGTGLDVASGGGWSGSAMSEQPVAFRVDGFDLSYVGADGTSYATLADAPSGARVVRLTVTLVMSDTINQHSISRRLTSYVELPQQFTLTAQPLEFVQAVQGTPNVVCP